MKRIIIVFLLLLSRAAISSAETFDIRSYDVNITINTNGSFDVTESILVNFSEASRGIIRDIPCHYKQNETGAFDKTQRSNSSEYFDIVVRNISVDGHEFNVTEENGITSIKIGSENKKTSGEKLYTIHYTVWGAINEFSDHNEFFWNIIGTDWGCNINKATFNIVCAKSIKLSADDVIGFTGKAGSTNKALQLTASSNIVSGQSNASLLPFHGITVAVRLPKNYFTTTEIPIEAYAHNFIIRKCTSILRVQADASLDVEERYEVEFTRPCSSFTRKFKRPDEYEILPQDYQDVVLTNIKVAGPSSNETNTTFSSSGFGRNKYITIKKNQGTFNGKVEFTITYKAWGAFHFNNGIAQLQWDIFPGTMNEPCTQLNFELNADSYMKVHKGIINFYSNGAQPVFIAIQKNKNTNTFSGTYPSAIIDNSSITLKSAFKQSAFTEASIPYDIYARNFVIRNFNTDFTVEPNGVVKMQHIYTVKFTDPENEANVFSTQVRAVFPHDLKNYTGINYSLPRWSMMGNIYKTILMDDRASGSNVSILPDWNEFSKSIIWRPAPSLLPDSVFSNEYRIFSILQSSGSNYIINFPLTGLFDEPIAAGRFSVHLPKVNGLEPVSCEACIQGPDLICESIPVIINGNEIHGQLIHGLKSGQSIVLKLTFPKAFLTKNSFFLYLQLLFKNNFFLLLPLLFFFILYIIWYYTGRDRKNNLIVQYRPPTDITPAEAGFLWDNKLHRRDLVALIYYWAGNGHLAIKEIAPGTGKEKDYELTKLQDLPESARSFEHTIFTALFHNRTSVLISSLKNNFYCHMIKAHRELDEYGRYKKFYVPGTRGFSLALRITAWAEFATGLFVLLNADNNFAQIFFCFISLFVMLLVFGNIMPKRGHFGAEKYTQLKGFREFIEKAEASKLKELLNENPAYFDETVAYAIVLGLGKQWAEKFKPLITAPPAWYSGQNNHFDTGIFVNTVILSMHSLDHSLNYHYAQSSRYGYSGQSGFSSHSTFGGSAFGGGGYTGGGFGGGGGRSW